MCELGDGAHRGELHFRRDGGGADIQRSPEDEWEAEHVVHLVRIVRAPGGDDAIGARLARELGRDLRLRVGEREDQRALGHLLHHGALQHAARREAEEHVGAADHLVERARARVLRVALLVRIHQFAPAVVDHALDVGDDDVGERQPHLLQEIEARERRRAGARRDELHLPDALADDLEAVVHGGAHRDGRAMLVIVEHGNAHALSQQPLHGEAFGRLDVLEVDGAERGLERGDDVDQLFRVALVDLDVEAVDAREFLEEHRLALHHRLRGERPDRAQTEHRGAIGDDANQVRARGVVHRAGGIAHDLLADGRHTGGVGEREIALVGELLGGQDRELARRRAAMVLEGALLQLLVHATIL